MLESIRNHTQGVMAKIILGLITIPFALFGIDSYFNDAGSNVAIAKVNNEKISIQEYSNAIENVRNRLQSEGQKVDAALLESDELKQSVLDGLITRRLVNAEIKRANFKISDEQLSAHILGMPDFQKDGKFSEDIYQKTLAQNKLSASKFENDRRGELLTQQAREGLTMLVAVPQAVTKRALAFTHQQREVSVAEIKTAQFVNETKVTVAQVQAYYDKYKEKFKVPEQVKLEFALLSAAGLVSQMSVSDAEVKQFYEENKAKFQGATLYGAKFEEAKFNKTNLEGCKLILRDENNIIPPICADFTNATFVETTAFEFQRHDLIDCNADVTRIIFLQNPSQSEIEQYIM